VLPNEVQPQTGASKQCGACGCGESSATEVRTEKIDDEMRNRRELNVQMRIAAENQDFEKAAELRDKIRELES
jgi:excinuclease UvrABC nuclease subunit